MPSVNVDKKDKKEFDKLKPEDSTHAEFFHELIRAKKRDNGEIVDVDKMVDSIDKRVASKCEEAAYRGVMDALDSYE